MANAALDTAISVQRAREARTLLAGLIGDILELYPDATVAASKVALMYLKGLSHKSFTQQAVKGGDRIDLGQGHELEFVPAPNLHWPDTMFSFDHATGVPPHPGGRDGTLDPTPYSTECTLCAAWPARQAGRLDTGWLPSEPRSCPSPKITWLAGSSRGATCPAQA